MRVGCIQSNYIPWRGYFDFINSVDLFVIHDDIQYTKGDWRNRNKIKTPTGPAWLTVPVKYPHTNQLICETNIDYSTNWQEKHLNRFYGSYYNASHFRDALRLLERAFALHTNTISELNVSLIKAVLEYFSIRTNVRMSSEFDLHGTKTDRLMDLMQKTEGTTYVSGPAGKNYLEESRFANLEYKVYDYQPYKQLWGGFIEATILDLIANCGPDKDLLRSK